MNSKLFGELNYCLQHGGRDTWNLPPVSWRIPGYQRTGTKRDQSEKTRGHEGGITPWHHAWLEKSSLQPPTTRKNLFSGMFSESTFDCISYNGCSMTSVFCVKTRRLLLTLHKEALFCGSKSFKQGASFSERERKRKKEGPPVLSWGGHEKTQITTLCQNKWVQHYLFTIIFTKC